MFNVFRCDSMSSLIFVLLISCINDNLSTFKEYDMFLSTDNRKNTAVLILDFITHEFYTINVIFN